MPKQELETFEFCCRHEKKVHLAVDVFDQGRRARAAVVKAEKRREEAAKAKALQTFN